MEKIKEQFSKITKDVREKNNLSQEDMASKLYLSGKQTIYYYEKGKRIMKLPEFIEFIKIFDEKVIIDKDGIKLLENVDELNKNKDKEIGKMDNKNFKFIEQKGDIKFYEDTNTQREYQQLPITGLIPVIDGEMRYQIIKTYGDISIRYNLNGCYGYSIWSGEKCLEDNFWVLDAVDNAVEELFLNVQKEKTIKIMVENVENKLEYENLSLDCLDFSSSCDMIESLDDVFKDGGEFRCESFTDITIPYSLNFGEIESDAFDKAKWECIDKAFEILADKSLKTVICKESSYQEDYIKFDYVQNNQKCGNENSHKVILLKNGKKLVFREFYFGLNQPSLDIVMESIKDDYILYTSSPTLRAYIANRGNIGDMKNDYKSLKLDVESMIDFFGKEYLNNLILE